MKMKCYLMYRYFPYFGNINLTDNAYNMSLPYIFHTTAVMNVLECYYFKIIFYLFCIRI